MTWLTPGLAALVAAIAIPSLVVLYFLKLRRRPLEISSTLLWKRAVQDLQANAPFQRLRRNILLLLQLLVLGGLLAALAQPQFEDSADVDQRHVILLDRSASMGSVDAQGRTRLERAKEEAIALVDSLSEGNFFSRNLGDQRAQEAMVIAFDDSAEVVTTFTSDKALLRRAIRGVEVGHAPGGLERAMTLARAHAPIRRMTDTFVDESGQTQSRSVEALQAGVGTIHVFSDGRLPDAQEVLAGVEDTVVYHDQGTVAESNIGIVSLRAERAYDDPSRLEIFVGLIGTGIARERTVDIEMRIGQTIRVYEVAIAPADDDSRGEDAPEESSGGIVRPGSGGTLIELDMAGAGLIEIRLVGAGMEGDALEVDNRAFLVVPAAQRTRVVLVSEGNPFLSRWLATLPFESFSVMAPEEFLGADRASYDIAILDRVDPFGGEPAPGRYLFLGTGVRGALGEIARGVRFADWSRQHPVTGSLVLDGIEIVESPRVEIEAGSAMTALARTEAGVAIYETIDAEVRAIGVVFDPLQSTWPFDVSFPVFVAGAIQHLASDGAGGEAARQIRPGGVLSDRLPAGARDVQVVPPDEFGAPTRAGHTVEPAPDGRIVFGPLDRVGVYKVRWLGSAGAGDVEDGSRVARFFSANLLDSEESDISPAAELRLASDVVRARGRDRQEVTRRLWPWLVLAALAIVMLEWWVYNRKVHV